MPVGHLGPVTLTLDGGLWGYHVFYGDAQHPGLEGRYFTAKTAFSTPRLPLPLNWNHDEQEVIGEVYYLGNGDEIGRSFMARLLDVSDTRRAEIAALVKARQLGASGEAIGVTYRADHGGAREVLTWKMTALALTPAPLEVRMIADGPDDLARRGLPADYVQAARDVFKSQERAELEALGRELDRMELEALGRDLAQLSARARTIRTKGNSYVSR